MGPEGQILLEKRNMQILPSYDINCLEKLPGESPMKKFIGLTFTRMKLLVLSFL